MDINTFKSIPVESRPAPFWSWNDNLNSSELTRQIDTMKEMGWGGYFMHTRVGLVTTYLSPKWFDLIIDCAKKGLRTDTYAWLYDEDKWPSGFAGGRVSSIPEYRARALILIEKDSRDPEDIVLKELNFDGIDYVIAIKVHKMGSAWFNGACYTDLMNPEAVKAFIESTHEKYKEHCGEYFGKSIPGIFTDEPCYMMHGGYTEPAVPWSEYLPDFFQKLKGYDIIPHLQQLFFEIDDYKKVRFDFFQAASKLFLESFSKPYYNWCERNGLKMTGHYMAEDSLTYQLQWIGNAMPHYEFMHLPGIDKLERHTEQTITVKQVSSVAEQLGKERAFSEVFGCIGQQCAFRERKWIADWEAILGISFANYHLSLYSMRGERKRDFPANLFYQQPWWSQEKPLSDYVARLSTIVAQGKRETDILVIHPIASAWSVYSPMTKAATPYDKPFEQLTNMLIANNLDFHYGDETIMENHGTISDGMIKIGQHTYSKVVVPPSITLSANTVGLLKEFKGQLIFVSPIPTRVDGVLCKNMVVGKTVSCVNQAIELLLADSQAQRIKTIDKTSQSNAKKVICCVKEIDGDKVIIFANTEESREVDTRIEIPEQTGQAIPYLLDMQDGNLYNLLHERSNGVIIVNARFHIHGSLAIVLSGDEIDVPDAPMVVSTGVSLGKLDTKVASGGDYQVKLSHPNALVINTVTLYMDGKKVVEDHPVIEALHKHFYKAPDGTPFAAEYKFQVDQVPTAEMFAVVECAHNLDSVILNGQVVKPLRQKGELEIFDESVNYLDVNYIKIPLGDAPIAGQNVLRIEGIKVNNITEPGSHSLVEQSDCHCATEVETVYIVGDFYVENVDNTRFSISPSREICHKNMTKSGAPFYGGKAEISCSFELPSDYSCEQPYYVRLNGVEAACVSVYVNSTLVGSGYLEPYSFCIPDGVLKKDNQVKVEVYSTLFNLTGPGWICDILQDRGVGPHTFINMDRYTDKYTLLPFGIDNVTIIN